MQIESQNAPVKRLARKTFDVRFSSRRVKKKEENNSFFLTS